MGTSATKILREDDTVDDLDDDTDDIDEDTEDIDDEGVADADADSADADSADNTSNPKQDPLERLIWRLTNSQVENMDLYTMFRREGLARLLNALHQIRDRSPNSRAVELLPVAIVGFIEMGRNAPQKITEGTNELVLACRLGFESVAVALLRQGRSDLRHRDPEGKTALSYAIQHNWRDVRELLISPSGLPASPQNGEYIFEACDHGAYDLVHKLLDLGDRFPIPYVREGRTALMVACEDGEEDVAVKIVERRPPAEYINTVDPDGDDALRIAIRGGLTRVVTALLDVIITQEIDLLATDSDDHGIVHTLLRYRSPWLTDNLTGLLDRVIVEDEADGFFVDSLTSAHRFNDRTTVAQLLASYNYREDLITELTKNSNRAMRDLFTREYGPPPPAISSRPL